MELKVYKYDPAIDANPYYVTGQVEYTEKMTVLEAIIAFHEQVGDVAFDYSCHGRMCGRCGVMVDGTPVLACCTPITDDDHVIEPLAGLTVIRDLVCDRSGLDEQLSEIYRRVRVEPITEAEAKDCDGATAAKMYELVSCTRCGVCNAGCPVFTANPDQYVGPAAMLAIAYRNMDPYDQGNRVLEAVSKGLYRCIQCGRCDEVCRRLEIDHLGAWATLRAQAEERGIVPSYV
jgi:succinate dehydrogenase/fumarate reductase iron-sulfur protein